MTEADSAERQLGPRPRILVIHGEAPLSLALRDALGDEFEISLASNAERALERLRLEPEFAVVIAGPDARAKGEHVLVQIAQLCDSARIFWSSTADPNALVHAINRSRVFAVLTSPIDPIQARLILTQAVEHHASLRDQRLLCQLMESAPDAIFFKDR
ncbi:MAG TPA: hypothetical protein VGI70_21630, partial [Polyangiales bacterium]